MLVGYYAARSDIWEGFELGADVLELTMRSSNVTQCLVSCDELKKDAVVVVNLLAHRVTS